MTPSLPPGYELVTVEAGVDPLIEATRRATAGADEGTLVWLPDANDNAGLDCALVLRPELALATASQVLYVGAVSLGAALADWVSPMIELRFRWPNEVRIGQANSAVLGLRWADNHPPEWLVLGVRLSGELRTLAEAQDTAGAGEILSGFARHFLADINRWAEEGFAPIRKRWMQRADGLGAALTLALGGETLSGTFQTVDADGRIVLGMSEASERRVAIVEYLRAPPTA